MASTEDKTGRVSLCPCNSCKGASSSHRADEETGSERVMALNPLPRVPIRCERQSPDSAAFFVLSTYKYFLCCFFFFFFPFWLISCHHINKVFTPFFSLYWFGNCSFHLSSLLVNLYILISTLDLTLSKVNQYLSPPSEQYTELRIHQF